MWSSSANFWTNPKSKPNTCHQYILLSPPQSLVHGNLTSLGSHSYTRCGECHYNGVVCSNLLARSLGAGSWWGRINSWFDICFTELGQHADSGNCWFHQRYFIPLEEIYFHQGVANAVLNLRYCRLLFDLDKSLYFSLLNGYFNSSASNYTTV